MADMVDSTMCLIHDTLVTHARQERQPETIYHLRLYVPIEPNGRLPVAVATELATNPGMSITSCCADLATGVMAYLWAKGYRYEALHWLEHFDDPISYGDDINGAQRGGESTLAGDHSERFALVEFEPGNEQRYGRFALRAPRWRHCTLQEVEALIDMAWKPVQVADSQE